jgi:hypothetical protein
MVHQIQLRNLGDMVQLVPLQDLNLVVAEISQITESAGYVVVGGSGFIQINLK